MIKGLVMVTYVDVTTITFSVEVVVRAPHEEAVVVGVQDSRLQADRGELAHLARLGDLVTHVVADSGLVGLSAPGHLGGGSLGESLTSLRSDNVS
jgi:hypothetical protein